MAHKEKRGNSQEIPGLSSSPLWLAICPSITHTQGRFEGENWEGVRPVDWKTLLAYVTGSVEEQLLLRIEYLVAENRILRDQIKGRLHVSDAERTTLAEIGKQLGKQTLEEIAHVAKPDTILGWHRKLVAQKFDGSAQRKSPGRPRVEKALEDLVVQMAKENPSWGYEISDQTVGNILKRRGLLLAPDRKKTTTWKEFIRSHMGVLVATDFFTTEVWTLGGSNVLCVVSH
jgi:putative transposase